MKFAIVILAVLAAVSAQQTGQYKPYNYNRYNNYNRNNAYYRDQDYYRGQDYYRPTYSPFYSTTPTPTYAPFKFSTPAPSTYVSPTYTPSTVAPPVARVPVVAPVYSNQENAEIVKYGNEINPDGSYNYYYETSNGIAAQEQGTPRNLGGNPPVAPDVAQGSFSWTSPEGVPIAISYVADENGYQPQGDAIPVPPPVPPQIARALEYLARNAPAQK